MCFFIVGEVHLFMPDVVLPEADRDVLRNSSLLQEVEDAVAKWQEQIFTGASFLYLRRTSFYKIDLIELSSVLGMSVG